MNKITEYQLVIGGEGGIKFANDINALIADGWQPTGGVSVIKMEGQKSTNPEAIAKGLDMESRILTFQAMIRQKNNIFFQSA